MNSDTLAEASKNYTIALQPIVDGQLRHVADELLYRGHFDATAASIDDDVKATARACSVAIYEIGLKKLCGARKLFVNVSEQWLLNPDLHALPANQVVLEILESTRPTQEVKKALERLKAQGYTLAIDDFQTQEDHQSLLEYCDIVKLDISSDITHEMIKSLQQQKLTLLAERVETREEFEHFKALGVTLFQGYFYERPTAQKTRYVRRSSPKANLLRLIAKLYKPEINMQEIRSLVAQDPYLVEAVLRRANSVWHALAKPSYKLSDCIQLLGVNELRTMVTIILFANNSPANKLNLIKGLTKALACEQVAKSRHMDDEEGFIIGLLSHMPVILNIDLDTLMKELNLGGSFWRTLITREGHFGAMLNDVESAESGIKLEGLPDSLILSAAARARSLIDNTLVLYRQH
ncbi:EAL domain-containing protein [Halomonas sp. PAMB 3264]|uniref:EAL and HDOD domain-containing protein n=1 Tax=Halomonas sp. PAMB 3264 TaxID=3075222 RepID=UPI00289ED2E5|nr:EAL domain-containing protein [Halomonas sp. PAMB 3264]WNL40686.1 EAL domain-containing protein [Halomonas sp. PAMB 3264]